MKIMKTQICLALFFFSFCAKADESHISLISSTTVFPFLSLFSEQFAKKFSYKTPTIESVGSGPAIKSFCSSKGENAPDIAASSRRIKRAEIRLCESNDIGEILEIKIGYDGIVVATSKKVQEISLSKKELFEALFAYSTKEHAKLSPNTFTNWSEISERLPDRKILIYGPHKNTGTYDSIVKLVISSICMTNRVFLNLETNMEKREEICSRIREDSSFVETGASEGIIVRKIQNNPEILGIFGLIFLLKNSENLIGNSIDGIKPTIENITSGKYPLSRSLYIYVKKKSLDKKQGLKEFISELSSKKVIGKGGYLSNIGLAPITDEEIETQQKNIIQFIGNQN